MKILIISNNFWPENFRINDLAVSLYDSGVDVSILTGTPNYPEGKIFSGYKFEFNKEIYKKKFIIHRVPTIPRGKKSTTIGILANYFSFLINCFFYTVLNRTLFFLLIRRDSQIQ